MFNVLYFNIIIIRGRGVHGGGPLVWGPPVRRGKGGDDGGSFFWERASLALACPHVGVYIDPL